MSSRGQITELPGALQVEACGLEEWSAALTVHKRVELYVLIHKIKMGSTRDSKYAKAPSMDSMVSCIEESQTEDVDDLSPRHVCCEARCGLFQWSDAWFRRLLEVGLR